MFKHNIDLDISWIPRKRNELADKSSKTINYEDWYVIADLFDRQTVGSSDDRKVCLRKESENNEIQLKTYLPGALDWVNKRN